MIYISEATLDPATLPNKSQVHRAIAGFMKDGKSGLHSERGVLLSHILNHCVQNGIPFVLRFQPGGYYLERSNEAE